VRERVGSGSGRGGGGVEEWVGVRGRCQVGVGGVVEVRGRVRVKG